jgi:hypothetical protein
LLWIGTLISSSGDWMDQIALNWLVYQLSGSAVQLAVLNLARLAPIFVFTLVGGVSPTAPSGAACCSPPRRWPWRWRSSWPH